MPHNTKKTCTLTAHEQLIIHTISLVVKWQSCTQYYTTYCTFSNRWICRCLNMNPTPFREILFPRNITPTRYAARSCTSLDCARNVQDPCTLSLQDLCTSPLQETCTIRARYLQENTHARILQDKCKILARCTIQESCSSTCTCKILTRYIMHRPCNFEAIFMTY